MVMSSCVLSNSQEAGVRGSLGSWEIWQALILCRGRRGLMKERRGEVRGGALGFYLCLLVRLWQDPDTEISIPKVSQSLPSYLSGAGSLIPFL